MRNLGFYVASIISSFFFIIALIVLFYIVTFLFFLLIMEELLKGKANPERKIQFEELVQKLINAPELLKNKLFEATRSIDGLWKS
ncbi:MAG TPA: hypothetical protein VIK89_10315 [Cytophagaceae bacterium]